MDHARIDEEAVAERYAAGRLPDDLHERFEAHSVDCPRCLDAIEAVEAFRRGLRDLPAGETAAAAVPAPARFVPGARAAGPFLGPAGLLAAACLLVGVGLSVLFYLDARRAASELAGARQEVVLAEKRQAEAERTLAHDRAEAKRLSDAAGLLRDAPVAAAVFRLNATRGIPEDAPENRLDVGDPSGWVALVFDRPDRTGFTGYRVRISGAGDRPVGEAAAAAAAPDGMLAVSVPAKLLTPGDYRLVVEGVAPSRSERLATYRFRVAGR